MTQIETEYGLNDMIRIKKEEVTSILYSFIQSDMNSQTILKSKGTLPNFLSQKTLQNLVVYDFTLLLTPFESKLTN